MFVMAIILLGTIAGIFFGFALEKSGVLNPEVIINQFLLKNFTMIRVFITAIITGLVIYQVLEFLGFGILNWKTMHLQQDLLGGALLGAGIAFAGACPGTVFGQIGVGYQDAFVTLLGAFLGALFFIYIKPMVSFSNWPDQKLLLSEVINMSTYYTRIILVIVLFIFLRLIKKLPN